MIVFKVWKIDYERDCFIVYFLYGDVYFMVVMGERFYINKKENNEIRIGIGKV